MCPPGGPGGRLHALASVSPAPTGGVDVRLAGDPRSGCIANTKSPGLGVRWDHGCNARATAVGTAIEDALRQYVEDVRTGRFPAEENTVHEMDLEDRLG